MADKDFSFDFDEIRIQDTDQAGDSTALDEFLLGENGNTPKTEKIEDTPTPKSDPQPSDPSLTTLIEDGSDEIDDEEILGALVGSETEDGSEDSDTDIEAIKAEQISKLVDNYYELGILTGEKEENPITTDEALLERFQLEKRNGANEVLHNFLSKFGEDYREAFQKIFVEGVHPKDYYTTVEPLQDISDLDLEQESNQIRVVRQYYRDILNIPEDLAEKKLKIMQDAGELVSEATIAVDKIQSSVKQALAAKAQAKAQEEADRQYTAQVYDTTLRSTLQKDLSGNDFKGLPVNSQTVASIYNNLVRPAWKLPDGQEITDFQKFLLDLKKPENVQTAILIDLLRQNNFDLSKIQTKKENAKKSQMFDALTVKETSLKRKNPVNNTAAPTKFI